MAETKTGGGGQPEAYDENTGKYIAQEKGNGGLEKYHSGSGASSKMFEKEILNGSYGQDFLDAYKTADSQTKAEMLEYVHSVFDETNTQNKMNEKFEHLSIREFNDLQNSFASEIGFNQEDWENISHYIGTGKTSFYLNTAARIGYDEMIKQFIKKEGYDPSIIPGNFLTRENVEKFFASAAKGAKNYKLKKPMRVQRYLGTGPIVSWFRNTGILDDFTIVNNGWHDRIEPGYDLDVLASKLKTLVGTVMPKDGSFMSVSMCPELSHMKGKSNEGKKDILMEIDLPEGQGVCMTKNHRESEGLLPKDIELFIKDVGTVIDDEDKKRVVIYYGVK